MKKTEEELQLHISRLESIIDNMPYEAWYKDQDGRYLIVNKRVEESLGQSRTQIVGKTDFDLYPEDTAKFITGSDRAAAVGEGPEFYELNLGNDVYEDYKQPVFDHSGNLIGTTGVSRNITQTKKATEELRESERNKTVLLSNMPGVAFRCDNDANYTVNYISDSCFNLTGYTAEELLSLKPSYNDLIHPEYRMALIGKWDSDHMDDTISTDEYPITTKSGEIKWVMEQSHRLYDADHKVIGSEGFIIDVTRRKEMEKALKRSEEQFRSIFEEAPLGIAIIDSHTGEIFHVNDQYAEIVGRTKTSLLSTNIMDYSYSDEIEEIKHKINLLKTGQITRFSLYKRLIKPDGSTAWVNITIAPFNSDDEYSGSKLLCMMEDITARRKAEEEILYLSYHDQLTGLYNHRFYEEELRRIDTERNLPITLVMADVNGLKLTNDAFGHQAGDRLLKYIADTIRKQCRADDIIARVGGDEFILLLPRTTKSQAEKLVGRISTALSKDKSYPVVCSVSFGWDTKIEPAEDIGKIYIKAEDFMYRHKLTESVSMRNNTIKLIMKTLFQRSREEARHARKVSWWCGETAKALEMSREEVMELRLAGLFHDIGNITFREELLNKHGNYTETERVELERHPEIGYQLLRSVAKYTNIAEYVLNHHERVDGTGYPSRSAGDQIPIQSRIITVADSYDAMTSEKARWKKLTPEEAIDELERNAGTQFDRKIVNVFVGTVLKKTMTGGWCSEQQALFQ